jgi:hypothetical protein
MTLHEFVYTKNNPQRCYRHITFWLARVLFVITSDWFGGYLQNDHPPAIRAHDICRILSETCCEILYTYCVVYLVFPRYQPGKKWLKFGGIFIGLSVGSVIAIIGIDLLFDPSSLTNFSLLSGWSAFWGNTGYGPPAVGALFLVIRSLITYNETLEEKEALIRENASAESQMLKAQVHPHFLFNTLNNIYAFALSSPSFAAGLVGNLSGTMHYMIAECEAPLVPLDKELLLIRNYMELEKVRYGDRLDIQINVNGDSSGKMIDPLLMIPLVENCFKHGASRLLDDSWIKLHIFIEGDSLRAGFSNNKPLHSPHTNRQGIGLNNVRKRLQLLHPGNHSLEIHSAPEIFTVFLQVPLKHQLCPFPPQRSTVSQ